MSEKIEIPQYQLDAIKHPDSKTEIGEESKFAAIQEDPAEEQEIAEETQVIEADPKEAEETVEETDLEEVEEVEAPETEEIAETPEEGEVTLGNLKYRRKDGVDEVFVKAYGEEKWIPANEAFESINTRAAQQKAWQDLAAERKAFEEQLNSNKEMGNILDMLSPEPAAPQADTMDDFFGETKPTQPVPASAKDDRIDKIVARFAAEDAQKLRNESVQNAVMRTRSMMKEFGIDTPEDWMPVGNAILTETGGYNEEFYRRASDPTQLLNYAKKAFASEIGKTTQDPEPSVPKEERKPPVPPLKKTTGSPKKKSGANELQELEAQRDKLQKELSNARDLGPDVAPLGVKLQRINTKIQSLKGEKGG
jgi:hypothetical protein